MLPASMVAKPTKVFICIQQIKCQQRKNCEHVAQKDLKALTISLFFAMLLQNAASNVMRQVSQRILLIALLVPVCKTLPKALEVDFILASRIILSSSPTRRTRIRTQSSCRACG
jgi:hypothetical protein